MFWYVQKHKISTVGASIISTDVQAFGMSSQHFFSSASLGNIVFHPIYVYVLWILRIDVTFEGLTGNYAVLSRIWILSDLRIFCANFLSYKVRLRFLHVCIVQLV